MNRPPVDVHAPSDPELIAAVRAGDDQAYGALFERHRGAALTLARQISGPSDADDLVSDAFMKVHRVLARGGGPDVAFRAYLLTAVRRLHVDKIRAGSKVMPSDHIEEFDPGVPFRDTAVDKFENAAAARAFASLPERWQLVLWHLEVERQKPAEIAPLLGLSANSVSALAYRAREGLRQAYLQMHLADTEADECRWVTERLGSHVRGGLSRRDAAKVDEHLEQCARCSAVYLELTEVNSNLAGILAPALLGAAAAAYLGAGGAGSGVGGLAGILSQARHLVHANSAATAATAAVGVVGVVAGTAFVAGNLRSQPDATRADDHPIAVLVTSSSGTAPTAGGTTARTQAESGRRSGLITGSATGAPLAGTPTSALGRPPGAAGATTIGAPTASGSGTAGVEPDPATTASTSPTTLPVTDATTTSTTTTATSSAPAPTTPTTAPISTPPSLSTVDVGLDVSLDFVPGLKLKASVSVATVPPATELTVHLATPRFTQVRLSPQGWTCSPHARHRVTEYVCTITSDSPSPISISGVFPNDPNPTFSVAVGAADNDDPDLTNNEYSLFVGPA